mmetsp:Transcript_15882/g.53137  ORF Transcript_15882/g.53137 Transcript_15882/m.53137 type:complete len:327 (-) Transcript_15882:1693-2673(-)
MYCGDRDLSDLRLLDVVASKLVRHLGRRGGADCGGSDGEHVADMHHCSDDLAGRLVGLVHRSHPLQLEVTADVDDGDPVLGGVEENGLALDQDLDVLHQVRHHSREGLDHHAVAGRDDLLLPVAAVDGEAAPVRAPQDLLVVSRSLLEVADDGGQLAQGDLSSGVGGEDTPDRLAALHGHEPLESLGGHEVLLLPLHHLVEDGLGVGVLLEVLPHRVQQPVDCSDQSALELCLAQFPGDKVVFDALKGVVSGTPSCESGLGHREDDILHVVEARVLEIVGGQVHTFKTSVDVLGLRCRGFIFGLARAVGVIDLPRHVLLRVLHEDR